MKGNEFFAYDKKGNIYFHELVIVDYLNHIPGYDKYYSGSDGNIYEEKDGKTIEVKQFEVDGFPSCVLIKENEEIICLVQDLVINTWHQILQPENHNVHHLDGDISNNKPTNLRWMLNSSSKDYKGGLCIVPGYSDYYAQPTGDIYSVKSGKLVKKKLYEAKDGYNTVGLTKDGSTDQKRHRVSIIIAKTLISNPDNLPTVNHINGKETRNNAISNLEWMSYSGQVTHAHATGLIKKKGRPVCQADKDGKLIAEFSSITKASNKTKVSVTFISAACQGKYRTAGGFTWYYKEEFVGQKMRKFGNCKTVHQFDLDENFIREFESVNEAAKSIGVSPGTMADACRGVQKTSKGYIWKYPPKEKKKDIAEKYKDWATIDMFPKYKFSPTGGIFSLYQKKELKPSTKKNGQRKIDLINKDGVTKTMAVHQLVGLAYIPNPEGYPLVKHLDDNPSNNNIKNLMWGNHSQNGYDAYATGINSNKFPVIKLTTGGKEIERYDGVTDAAKANGVSRTALSYALNGKTKTCCGFKWKYAPKENKSK